MVDFVTTELTRHARHVVRIVVAITNEKKYEVVDRRASTAQTLDFYRAAYARAA